LQPSIPGNSSYKNHAQLAKIEESRTSIPTRRFRQVTPGKGSFGDEKRECGSDNDENGDHLASSTANR
jgi:hypothetical protein